MSTAWIRSRPPLAELIAGSVGLALLGTEISWLLCRALNYDEAYNGQVSLNLVLSGSYRTWYHHLVPFNVQITTGPPVLLPAAAALSLFGLHYWALRSVMAIFFAVFLWLSYLTLLPAAGRLAPAGFALFAALFVFIPGGFETASLLLGEIPALCFLLSAGVVMRRAARNGHAPLALVAGCLLGLGVLTKLLLALCVPGFFLALVVCSELRGRWRTIARLACCFGVGVLLPLVAWQLVMLGSLGWKGYLGNVEQLRRWMHFAGSGIDMKPRGAARGFWAHIQELAAVLRAPPEIALGAIACAAVALLWVFLSRPLPFSAWSLLLSAVALWAWWLGFSSWKFYRHLLPGYVLSSLLVPLGVCAAIARDGRGWIARLVPTLVLALSAAVLSNPRIIRPMVQREPRLTTQLAASATVRELLQRDATATFWGVGWDLAVPEISFLAGVPFRDLSRDAPDRGESYLVTAAVPAIRPYLRDFCAAWVFRRRGAVICRLKYAAPRAPPDRVVRLGLMP